MKALLLILPVLIFSTSAFAAWEVTYLHPAGSTYSYTNGISLGQQIGYADVGNYSHASLWRGTAASWVDLSPAGSTFSIAKAVSNGQQVGYAFIGGTNHAGLWSGTSASWVDLTRIIHIESKKSTLCRIGY